VSLFEPSLLTLLLTAEVLPLNEESETFLKGKVLVRTLMLLAVPGIHQTIESEVSELVKAFLHDRNTRLLEVRWAAQIVVMKTG